jgi:hypothetical protein
MSQGLRPLVSHEHQVALHDVRLDHAVAADPQRKTSWPCARASQESAGYCLAVPPPGSGAGGNAPEDGDLFPA